MLNFPKGDNASSAKAGNTEYSDEQAAANQTIIGLDDYNHLLSLQGKAPITLGANEFAISYAFPPLEDDLKAFAKNPEPLTLAGTTLTLAQNGLYHNAWENKNALVEEGTVIVPQSVAEGLKPVRWVLTFNFAENVADAHTKLYDNWFSASVEGFQLQAGQEVIVSIGADNLLTTYLGLYLGITFLITSGAVLALQQLSLSLIHI